jgi:hypothetical protein
VSGRPTVPTFAPDAASGASLWHPRAAWRHLCPWSGRRPIDFSPFSLPVYIIEFCKFAHSGVLTSGGSGAKGGAAARILGVLHGSYPVERREYHEVTGDVICPSHVRGIDHIRDPRLNKVSASRGALFLLAAGWSLRMRVKDTLRARLPLCLHQEPFLTALFFVAHFYTRLLLFRVRASFFARAFSFKNFVTI